MALFISGWNGGAAEGIVASDFSERFEATRVRILGEVEEGSFDLGKARAWMERFCAEAQAGLRIAPVEVRDETVAAAGRHVPIRRYNPGGHDATTLFIHGGGWILGSVNTHDNVPRWLTAETGGRAVSIGYSLAPEAPFPQALDECAEIIRAFLKSKTPRGRLFVMGDSAGANLAAMAILRLTPAERARIDGFVSLYGAFSPDLNLSSHKLYGDGRYGLSEAQMRWFWALYAPQLTPQERDRLTLLSADLAGFPPTLCIGTECDMLLDDTLAFYSQLAAARVDVRLALWPGLPHGCMHFVGGVESVDQAAASILNFIDVCCEAEPRPAKGEPMERDGGASPAPDRSHPVAAPAVDVAGGGLELVYVTNRTRLHGSVAHRLATGIIGGELPPGRVLPNEETASVSYGVSRTAYREAVRTLVAKGLLTAKPKVGTTVSPRTEWHLLDGDVLNWHFEGDPDRKLVRDLFELRALIEPSAAALAAARRREDDMSRLADCLARMAKTGRRSVTSVQSMVVFHQTVLKATGNDALQALGPMITATLIWLCKQYLVSSAGHGEPDPVGDYARVFERIAALDGEGARAAMADLLRNAFRELPG